MPGSKLLQLSFINAKPFPHGCRKGKRPKTSILAERQRSKSTSLPFGSVTSWEPNPQTTAETKRRLDILRSSVHDHMIACPQIYGTLMKPARKPLALTLDDEPKPA